MRSFCAALAVVVCLGGGPAAASIRITSSIYENGMLLVAGQTGPHKRVSLDDKYVTQSDGDGRFEFHAPYRPETCMANITTDEDAYSTVITNCLLGDAAAAADGNEPRPTSTTEAK
jgi:hypothetical protein